MSENTLCDICGRIEHERSAEWFELDSKAQICICQSCNGSDSDEELREMFEITLIDKGTMDAVVFFRDREYTYSHDLLLDMGKEDFLTWARSDIIDQGMFD